MDYLQLASQALVSGVGVTGLVLSAFHVKNANAVASDAVATLSDAIAAMHGNLSGVLHKLVAASPTLLADGVRLAADLGAAPPDAKEAKATQVVAETVTVTSKP